MARGSPQGSIWERGGGAGTAWFPEPAGRTAALRPGSSLLGAATRSPLSSAESKVGVLLSKRCAPRCPNTNMAYAWLSEPWFFRRIIRQCCNVSFCNAAPPAPGWPWARPGGLLLPLGLSLLAASP